MKNWIYNTIYINVPKTYWSKLKPSRNRTLPVIFNKLSTTLASQSTRNSMVLTRPRSTVKCWTPLFKDSVRDTWIILTTQFYPLCRNQSSRPWTKCSPWLPINKWIWFLWPRTNSAYSRRMTKELKTTFWTNSPTLMVDWRPTTMSSAWWTPGAANDWYTFI